MCDTFGWKLILYLSVSVSLSLSVSFCPSVSRSHSLSLTLFLSLSVSVSHSLSLPLCLPLSAPLSVRLSLPPSLSLLSAWGSDTVFLGGVCFYMNNDIIIQKWLERKKAAGSVWLRPPQYLPPTLSCSLSLHSSFCDSLSLYVLSFFLHLKSFLSHNPCLSLPNPLFSLPSLYSCPSVFGASIPHLSLFLCLTQNMFSLNSFLPLSNFKLSLLAAIWCIVIVPKHCITDCHAMIICSYVYHYNSLTHLSLYLSIALTVLHFVSLSLSVSLSVYPFYPFPLLPFSLY